MTSNASPKLRPLNPENGFTENAAGFKHSPSFGFGLVDAERLVAKAREFRIPREIIAQPETYGRLGSRSRTNQHLIPITRSAIRYLESIVVKINIITRIRGRWDFQVTSPSGTRTTVFAGRSADYFSGFSPLKVKAVGFWGENPLGNWRLEVKRRNSRARATRNDVFVVNWMIRMHGLRRDVRRVVPPVQTTRKPIPTFTLMQKPKPTVTITRKPKPTVTITRKPKPTVTITRKPKPAVTFTGKPKPTARIERKSKQTFETPPPPPIINRTSLKPTISLTTTQKLTLDEKYIHFAGRLYYIPDSKQVDSWEGANSWCSKLPGGNFRLAGVFSRAENNWLAGKAKFNELDSMWLGAIYLVHKNKWFWSNGSVILRQFWYKAPRLRGRGYRGRNCAVIDSRDGRWRSRSCAEKLPFVCAQFVDGEIHETDQEIMQQRIWGKTTFFRNQYEYKVGFGDRNDFWVGLQRMREKSKYGVKMIIEIVDWEQQRYSLQCSNVSIGPGSEGYRLKIDEKSCRSDNNLAITSLLHHNKAAFHSSKPDFYGNTHSSKGSRCAAANHVSGGGGWWFPDQGTCVKVNLNGEFKRGIHSNCIRWMNVAGKSENYCFKRSIVKFSLRQ